MRGFSFSIIFSLLAAAAVAQEPPRPVRNDVSQAGEEVLVLRHQKLRKGAHEAFYRISREGVWPWFEKLGARVVGQWQMIFPQGGGSAEYDEGYRLARYRSYEHWEDTRQGESIAGNGRDSDANRRALAERNRLLLGSDGAYFLQGHMAPGGPYYLPGLDERFELIGENESAPDDAPRPVRHDIARPGREIVTLRYWKIRKGSFAEFHQASVEGVWPYFEKIGARVVGQWKVIHPAADQREDSPDYDEVLMMTRYASYEHWQATREGAGLGGDGPDYDKLRSASALRRSLSSETWVKFLQGYLYGSPPVFLPALEERYRLKPNSGG